MKIEKSKVGWVAQKKKIHLKTNLKRDEQDVGSITNDKIKYGNGQTVMCQSVYTNAGDGEYWGWHLIG